MNDHIITLTQRRDYLTGRIEAKQKVGWEYQYDQREREALTWAIEQVQASEERAQEEA